MEKICDFANERTIIPPNLVRVIPDKTWNVFLKNIDTVLKAFRLPF